MTRKVFYAFVLIAGAAMWLSMRPLMPGDLEKEIEYRGERFKLTKAYSDYDDYKDDPNNLDPSENGRVERAVIGAKLSPAYSTRRDMIHAVFEIQFPGYGLSSFGEKSSPDGTSLDGFSIEIPRAEKERVLVFRGRAGSFALLDDFVTASDKAIMNVRLEGGKLVYCDVKGKERLARPLAGD